MMNTEDRTLTSTFTKRPMETNKKIQGKIFQANSDSKYKVSKNSRYCYWLKYLPILFRVLLVSTFEQKYRKTCLTIRILGHV